MPRKHFVYYLRVLASHRSFCLALCRAYMRDIKIPICDRAQRRR
jgi:hypothetical protein